MEFEALRSWSHVFANHVGVYNMMIPVFLDTR
jgi:hypothetical protein